MTSDSAVEAQPGRERQARRGREAGPGEEFGRGSQRRPPEPHAGEVTQSRQQRSSETRGNGPKH